MFVEATMLDTEIPSPTEIRQRLQQAVVRDLLGPANGPEEIVEEANVRGRYILGLLAPQRQSASPINSTDDDEASSVSAQANPEENDELAVSGRDTEDGKTDAPAPKAVSMVPSSIGMTFTVSGSAQAIQVATSWGRYQRVSREEAGLDPDKGRRNPWKRIPVTGKSQSIPLKVGRIGRWSPCKDTPEVVVDGLIRKYDHGWTVTLFLVNGQNEPKKNKDSAWIFQPELSVESPDGKAIFERHLGSRLTDKQNATPEVQANRMLYRKQVEFGVGHGVAIHAELGPDQFDCAMRLSTQVVPAYELPPTRPASFEGAQLQMLALAEMDDAAYGSAIQPLLKAYSDWIVAREAEIAAPSPDLAPHRLSAQSAIDNCKRALQRMQEGLDLLQSNSQASEAFRFANRAMHLQRLHTLYAQAVRQKSEAAQAGLEAFVTATNETPSWRPFQLAFILLNLPALSDPLHTDRSESREAAADVLWFPTGGGKTEAYLGLTAFTLGMRRLQGRVGDFDGGAGVAVLMRYTLRLLTLQQFQRATTLICACEAIRRESVGSGNLKWGLEPFRIGLWVGQSSTPNRTEESAEIVKELRRSAGASAGGRSTPYQLTTCPWCGQPIRAGSDIEVESFEQGQGRTLIYCSDKMGTCLFGRAQAPGEGLPVVVVDEEIYRRLPALLIATVDKFAQMPWKGEVQMLFGKVTGFCTRHGFRSPDINDTDSHPVTRLTKKPAAKTIPCGPLRPPDLIIQDELHLINGPLGTLVGLYESAVDELATWEWQGHKIRPKVIASSATIRKATEQVAALYGRTAQIFPPPALDASDSFFARQTPPTAEMPGRLYIGLCAPAMHMKALLIRIYVAYLAAAQQLYVQYGKLTDPWMTLIGYFNSIRELGGMRRATEDAVSTRLKQIELRGLAKRFLNQVGIEELTSRKSAADIPLILDRLEATFDPAEEISRKEAFKRGERGDFSRVPIDVLLATNMISVGVDVSRLGLMVVANQPKNTAEYIQATSRIGRQFPGLVCVAYNWSRPRDLSHYERFEHYHATFYQQVEALSVTPFSPRALDRGLAAVLVACVRLLSDSYNANSAAGNLDRQNPLLKRAVDSLARRAGLVTESAEVEAETRRRLNKLVDQWLAQAAKVRGGAGLLAYREEGGKSTGLLKTPGELGNFDKDPFTALNSLRDVEPSVHLILDNYGMDDMPD